MQLLYVQWYNKFLTLSAEEKFILIFGLRTFFLFYLIPRLHQMQHLWSATLPTAAAINYYIAKKLFALCIFLLCSPFFLPRYFTCHEKQVRKEQGKNPVSSAVLLF